MPGIRGSIAAAATEARYLNPPLAHLNVGFQQIVQ